jgi:Putative transposase
LNGERVSFLWRDYAHGGKQRVMTLDAVNFLCRFFLHVLPKGFVRIRRYGLLSNRFRKQLLPLARTLIAQQGREPLPLPPLPDCPPWHCPRCGKAMRVVERFTAAQLYFAGFDSSGTPSPTRSDGLLPARLYGCVRIGLRTAPPLRSTAS